MVKIKNICLLTLSTSGGGAERVLTHLANGFDERGYDVTYAALYYSGYYNINKGIKKAVLSSQGRLQALRDIYKLVRFFKNERYDVVICFGYPISIKYSICSLFIPSKIVIMSERNDPGRNVSSRVMRFLRKWAYSKSSKMVFQTEEAMSYFSPTIRKKGVLIPNPLILQRDFSLNPNSNRIIALGRISPQKNFEVLIKAFSLVIKEIPGIRLSIFGKKEENEYCKLERLVEELNLKSSISFKGFSNDIYSELENSTIYVSSSDYEGISNSVMEAMACGLPVVCTDCPCGGNRLLITNDVSGVLVPVGDYVSMAKAMIRILSDSDFRNKLGLNAKISMKAYSLSSIIDKWVDILN